MIKLFLSEFTFALELRIRHLVDALLAEVDSVLFPLGKVLLFHAPQVNRPLHALFANGSRVLISLPHVEVALVDSFDAHLAVHVLKVVHLLHFIFDLQAFFPA